MSKLCLQDNQKTYFNTPTTHRVISTIILQKNHQFLLKSAIAHSKAINASTNISALVVFLTSGQIYIALGLAAAVFNMLGNYVGSGLVMKKSTRITKPIILTVLILLLIKIIL
ncbi:TSUP family transporter [Butyrivibrio sp. VCD2006]|uniref:TSUP family transporter n=1 Tax=Butyrivibrio sp. VCD2006 TaxID=1280664 RepID=UPI002FE67E2A